MIGMQDDMRFLTGSRHDDLLEEAEKRRLLGEERDTLGRSALGKVRRLLHGHLRAESVAPVMPAPIAFERTASVASECRGSHDHGAVAA